jgi:ABC-type uncharacterized transport system ATPase subunit
VQLSGITKFFPGVKANDHIDFSLQKGEIHALLGENGAGKTTLMNVLYGLYRPDSGDIYVHSNKVNLTSPKDAISLGIGMVHQHFMLVPELTVAQNIVLGKTGSFFLRKGVVERKVLEVVERYGFALNPKDYVWQLPVGVQQRVEIAKALYRGADILILDEPTAVLTPQEVDELFSTLKSMAEQGQSVVFITHKLDEAIRISHKVTVMRAGQVVATMPTTKADSRTLAAMMVGRQIMEDRPDRNVSYGEVVLEVRDLSVLGDKGTTAVSDLSFTVREGEVLGVAGVDGNGQVELAECLTGLRRAVKGQIFLDEIDVTNRPSGELIRRGISHIPEDRQRKGLIAEFSVQDNLILGQQRVPPFSTGKRLSLTTIKRHAQELIEAYDIRTPSEMTCVGALSGGNQQKVLLARELSRNPKVIIALQPTRGLDVGATEYVHNRILEERAKGKAILLISTELDEILSLSDRVAVMYAGQFKGMVDPSTPREEIGLLMAGSSLRMHEWAS